MITTGAISKAAMLKKMQLANKFIVPGFKYAKRVAKAQEIALSAVHGAAVSHNVASVTSLILAQKPLTTRQRVSALVGGAIGGGTNVYIKNWFYASFVSGSISSPLGNIIEGKEIKRYELYTDIALNMTFSGIAQFYPKSAMPKLSRRAKRLVRKNKLTELYLQKYFDYKKKFEHWVLREEVAM